jgi:nucleotide-binding universal stress UspA family protein
MILPKIEIKKILYATDMSESARQALAYAVSLAGLYKAGITIVHVLEESAGMEASVMYHVGPERWAEIKKQHENNARSAIIGKQREDSPAMKAALKEIYQGVPDKFENQSLNFDDVVVKRGNPVDVIIDTAEKKRCDLIVLGTHGHGGLAKMMLGSTAQKVLKQSKVPVLVVRLPE